jgi:DNA-binding GntR family transcriptional regulator
VALPLPRLPIAQPRPLREQAYGTLRQAIVEGAYPAGAKLVEAELAAALSISRTPVREALHKLELEGLVERSPGGGLRVAALSPGEIEEIYGLRAVLEGYAARLAAPRTTPADAARLTAILDASATAMADDDRQRLLRLNVEFHAALVALAGSRRLSALARSLGEQITRYRAATLRIGGQDALGLAEHRGIVAALAAGDAAEAERRTVAHVERKMRDVAARLLRGAL